MLKQAQTWKTHRRKAKNQLSRIGFTDNNPIWEEARNNLAVYGKLVSGYEAAEHHKVWLDAIATGIDTPVLKRIGGNNLRICAPRGAAKTTWAAITLSWIIGHNPGIRIVLASYSEEIAIDIGNATKGLIEEDIYRFIFPNIQKSKRWKDKRWWIDRKKAGFTGFLKDPTLLAVGSGGSIASRRADLVVIDDPLKSSDSINKVEMRSKFVNWWYEVMEPCLTPGARAIAFGTRYRPDDIHGTDWCESKGWTVVNQKAIVQDENGEERSYWPRYVTLESLLKKRENNPIAFASQYQNEPMDLSTTIIQREWIRKGKILDQLEQIVIAIDLAISKKETAHYSAIAVCGRNLDTFYAVDCIRGRWSMYELIMQVIKTTVKYQSLGKITILVENVAYQAAFMNEYKRISAEIGGTTQRIEPIVPIGDKESRLRGISGIFESLKVIFNESVTMNTLIDELTQFGFTTYDDCADALTHAIQYLYKHRKKLSMGGYS